MDATDRSPLPGRPSTTTPERDPLPRDVSALPALEAEFDQIVDDGAREIGLELSAAQRAAIDAHVQLLLAWNAHINLSGLREAAAIARGHVLDALVAVPALRELARGRGSRAGDGVTLLDIGSGGGYPGLPLAVVLPAKRAALVDSIAKKAAFLEAAAAVVSDELRAAPPVPDMHALAERAEDLADEPDQRETWDLVVARAVGTVAECAELGLPLVRRYGHVVIWKRASDAAARQSLTAEMAQARRIVQAAGGASAKLVELDAGARVGLPGSSLVVIKKVRTTPDRYPRSAGERRRGTLT